ncbi:hypothetical protein BsWGS_10893 [Bradybaena similaris]
MAELRYLAWRVAALLALCAYSQETPPVKTSAGSVLGKVVVVVVDGREVEVETFWGIPYAKPPTGVLRFQRTEPVEPWTGVKNAWNPPKACMQHVDYGVITSPNQMSEDCLYLNIWRPHCNQTNMATMVWIHGGLLMNSGSSTDPLYNGEKLAARECVIVASMNYRLGVFGFLYTGQPNNSGNAGLFDVLFALRFLNSNINLFGGNNYKVTLFGNAAGAYIVSTFLMSTLGTNLFRNAILQSGSPLMHLMYQSRTSATDATNEVAKHANCSSSLMANTLLCLKQVNSNVLVDAFHNTTKLMQFRMVSVNDGEFLTDDPSAYLKNKSTRKCSILTGSNKNEATEILIRILPVEFNTSNHQPLVLSDQKVDTTLNAFLGMLYKSPYLPHIVSVLKLIYGYNKLKISTYNPSLHFLSKISRDLAYTCPQQALIDTYTQQGNTVYVYSFNRAPKISDLPKWVGATHMSEIRYIFSSTPRNQPENFVCQEFALSKKMMKMWADFAKHGNPTPNRHKTPHWKPYEPGQNIIVFTEKAKVKADKDEHPECLYWNSITALMRI